MKKICSAAVLAAMLLTMGACYRHVVRAEGTPPGRYPIYEPNLKDEPADSSLSRQGSQPTLLKPRNEVPVAPATKP